VFVESGPRLSGRGRLEEFDLVFDEEFDAWLVTREIEASHDSDSIKMMDESSLAVH
jgi:hypothetical protein